MFCKDNEQQLSACHHDANMKYQTYSSSSSQFFFYSIALLYHCFCYVNMDVFDCCARISCSISCMKRHSKNAVLKLKEVHSHLLACFSYSTAHVTSLSTQKHILCEWRDTREQLIKTLAKHLNIKFELIDKIWKIAQPQVHHTSLEKSDVSLKRS